MIRLSLAALIAFSASAQAQTCAPHDKFKAELENNHGEKPILILVQPNGSVLEVFTNSSERTWSVLNVRPNSFACLIGAGKGYVPTKQKLGEAS